MRDLQARIPGAPSFKYKEFVKSDAATRLGINNIPTDEEWEKIELLAVMVLQPVRNHFGRIRITSGFRAKKLNKTIGGSTTSNHCRGEASDIEPLEEGVTLLDVIKWIYENLEFRTLILEFPPDGWVHVVYREGGNLKRLKLKDRNHNYQNVSIDYLEELYL